MRGKRGVLVSDPGTGQVWVVGPVYTEQSLEQLRVELLTAGLVVERADVTFMSRSEFHSR